MKIVYLHQYFNLPSQPGSTRSFGLASRLVEMGHEVHMVTTDRTESENGSTLTWRRSVESGINVHWTKIDYNNRMSFVRRIFAFAKFAFRAALRARTIDGDIVFATSTPLTIAIPAIFASRSRRIPMVFEVRDLWPAVPIAIGAIRSPITKFLSRWLEEAAYNNSVAIVALAPGMAEAVANTGYPESKITVIPNGADDRVIQRMSTERALEKRAEFNLEDYKVVLYCGTLGQVNGVSFLVDVAQEMLDIDPNIKFVIVGDGAEREIVLNRAKELEVENRNLFFVGRVSKSEASEWLLASDMTFALFTGPAIVWKDATQNKFFDSLAAGKPIVSNFDGWQCQIANKHQIGFTVSPDDAQNAAREISSKLNDKAWMRHASDRAKYLAQTEFSMDTHARSLNQLLQDALNRSG